MTSRSARVLASSLDKLQISQDTTKPTLHSKAQPAESWEDEAADDTPVDEQAPVQPLSSPVADFPEAPPTSPASPSIRTKATSSGSPFQTFPPYGMNGSFEAEADDVQPGSRRTDPERRPEKTTSVASRLIAAGIGQKPPRRTQEQRDYDQAMKMQEKKRRDAAKEDALRTQQEKEKAKLAVWED